MSSEAGQSAASRGDDATTTPTMDGRNIMTAHPASPWQDTFDTKLALTALYLWLLFGYLSSMVGCDLQKLMQQNKWARHGLGMVAFFFLFTTVDTSNKADVGTLFVKTLAVYLVFIMMIKSKWYFALPTLAVLIVDQAIKVHADYLVKNQQPVPPTLDVWRSWCTRVLIILIVVGFVTYIFRQRAQYGDKFSWDEFLFSSTCDMTKPI